jgi:hypothetical protein
MTGNNEPHIVIQLRDEHLLRELASMRVIDREQAKIVAGFGSTTRANTRLLTLYRVGLLRRFFQGTAAGGRKSLYALSLKGARLVGESRPVKLHYGNDELLATNFFVAHQLRVNAVYCAMRYQRIPTPGISFVGWQSFSQPVAPRLVPDGFVSLATPQGTVGSFLEIDLGFEGTAVWKAKVEAYLRYASSGSFAKALAQPQFRVLVITNSEKRVRLLANLIARFTNKVFWLASFETIDRDGLWSPIWIRPSNATRKSLF